MMTLQKPEALVPLLGPGAEIAAVAPGVNAAPRADSAGFDGALLRARHFDGGAANAEVSEAEPALLTTALDADTYAPQDVADSAAFPHPQAEEGESQASRQRLEEAVNDPRQLLDALLAAAQSPVPPMQMLTSGARTIAVQVNAALRGIGAGAAEALPQAANLQPLLDRVNRGPNPTGGNSAAGSALPQAGADPVPGNLNTPPFIGQTAAVPGRAGATADLAQAGVEALPHSLSARPMVGQIDTASGAAIASTAAVDPGAAMLSAARNPLTLSPLSAGLTTAGAGTAAYSALAQAGATISPERTSEPAQPGQITSTPRAAGASAGADLLLKQAGAEVSSRPTNLQPQPGQIASAPADLLTGQAGTEALLRTANGGPAASVAVLNASDNRVTAGVALEQPGVELAARTSNGQPLPGAGDKAGVNAAAGSAPAPQGALVNSAPGTAGAAAAAALVLPGAEPQSRTPDAPLTAAHASAVHHGMRANVAQPQPGAALPTVVSAPRAAVQAAALREAVRDELPARMSALLPTSSAAEGAVAPLHAARQVGTAAVMQPEAAAAPVMTARPAPDTSPWAQQLKSALGERLQIQLKNQIQHATIRLDPPEMGKIDIALKLDGGRMQVHISAGQADVYRALQQTSGELRQMLVGHHVDQVTVQVSAQSGQQQQGRGHAAGEPPQTTIAAAAEMADAGAGGLHQQDDSVLLTV